MSAAGSARWRASGTTQRWGFHQLSERSAHRLVVEAGIRPGDLVLDIGAGAGALTKELVAAGASVLAFELHERRAELLRMRFSSDDVRVVRADASDLRLPKRPFRVVANPPFSLTAVILKRLLAPGSRLVAADVVVPFHVASRWANGRAPGAGRWSLLYDARVGAAIPSSAFTPAGPRSATLVLRARRLP